MGEFLMADAANLKYAYSELRYDIWEYLKEHGSVKTLALYEKMCNEEGPGWVRDALGDKLLNAIVHP